MTYVTLGTARNDVDRQLNQGASIVIFKEADSLYPIVHEQLSAHIPAFECHPIPLKSIEKYI